MPSTPDFPTGSQHGLTHGAQSAWIASVGGGVRAYEIDGDPVLRGYGAHEAPPMAAGTQLVPWPNRIAGARYTFGGIEHRLAVTEPATGNAIHGLDRRVPWDCIEEGAAAVTLAHEIAPQEGYPFALRLTVRWSLGPDGLRAEHEARNIGEHPAPFGLGVHPYVDLHGSALDPVRLRLPVQRYLVTDERGIPVRSRPVEGTEMDFRTGRALGATRLDTPFAGVQRNGEGRGEVVIEVPGRPAVVLWADAAFDYLQVFTPQDVAGGGPAIAVEPMTCAPDAFNSGDGLLVLEAGQTWRGSWGVKRA